MTDTKLKKMKEILCSNPRYKNMKIGYRIEEGNYCLIYHYQKNFDIFDMEFHDMMGKIIQEVFYNRGITNVGQLNLIEEELKEYFPEMFDIQIEEKLEVVNKNKAILKRNILFIEEVFYKSGITNVGQRDILEREMKEYFPEMFDIQIEKKLEIINKNKATLKRNIVFIKEKKEKMPSIELYSSNENIYYSQAA